VKRLHVAISMSLVALLAFSGCGLRRTWGESPSSQRDHARADIAMFCVALSAFMVDNGRYPTTAEGLAALVTPPSGLTSWKGPYIGGGGPGYHGGVPNDPWGNPYVYVCPRKHNPESYDLHSFGPDGKDGTEDDITNWSNW
jgi:general secretion pathway protein G